MKNKAVLLDVDTRPPPPPPCQGRPISYCDNDDDHDDISAFKRKLDNHLRYNRGYFICFSSLLL